MTEKRTEKYTRRDSPLIKKKPLMRYAKGFSPWRYKASLLPQLSCHAVRSMKKNVLGCRNPG